jgi:uncharacterized protein (TIGR00369 family)
VSNDIGERVRDSFNRQNLMSTLGARVERVAPGEVDIALPIRPEISQQHGFVHAGAIASIADSACGYAALTLLDSDSGVLAVEFKINLMSPGAGETLLARGRVIKSGRTLSICQADVVALKDGSEQNVAVMIATIMNVRGKEGVAG